MNFGNKLISIMKRKLIVAAITGLALVGLVINGAQAQNVFYDQFHQTPLLTNPASAAMSNYMSANIGYHSNKVASNQGVGYAQLSVIYPIFRSKQRGDTTRQGYAGLMLLRDGTKMNGAMNVTGGAVSYGHNVQLTAKGDKLALGIQAGFFFRQFDAGQYLSGKNFDQNNGTIINDPSLNGLNTSTNSNVGNAIVNVGLNYYREDNETGAIKHYVGFAVQNVNKPSFALVDNNKDNARVPITLVTTAGIQAYDNESWTVTPNLRNYFINSKALQTNLGSLVHYKINDGVMAGGNVGMGAWYSSYGGLKPTGAVVSVEANHPNFTLALSYNWALASDLTAGNTSVANPEVIVGVRKLLGRNHKKPAPTPMPTPPPPAPAPVKRDTTRPVPPPAPVPVPEPTPAPVPAPTPEPKKEVVKPVKKGKKGKKGKGAAKAGTKGKATSKGKGGAGTKGKKGGSSKDGLTAAQRKLLAEKPLYAFNSVALTAKDKQILDSISLLMAAKPNIKLQIDGHADKIGSDAVNFKVAQGRADSAVDYLVNKGISADRLTTKSYGKTMPIATNETPEGRAKNRRVEFKVMQ